MGKTGILRVNKGVMEATSAVVQGKFSGILVCDNLYLDASAVISGDCYARSIVCDAGALVEGVIRVRREGVDYAKRQEELAAKQAAHIAEQDARAQREQALARQMALEQKLEQARAAAAEEVRAGEQAARERARAQAEAEAEAEAAQAAVEAEEAAAAAAERVQKGNERRRRVESIMVEQADRTAPSKMGLQGDEPLTRVQLDYLRKLRRKRGESDSA